MIGNLVMALQEKSDDHQTQQASENLMAIQPVVVELFQSGPRWWNWQMVKNSAFSPTAAAAGSIW